MRLMDASGMPRIASLLNCFIAGSIFGGVMFNFEKGKVSRIFIGAAAE